MGLNQLDGRRRVDNMQEKLERVTTLQLYDGATPAVAISVFLVKNF